MPTKKQTNNQPKKKADEELEKKANELSQLIYDFFKLSRSLLSSDCPEYVNQNPEDWKYTAIAKEIAHEMGVDWEKMTYEENNALMLNMLLEYWAGIEDYKDLKPILKVAVEKPK